jgi:Glycosyl hydrolases family 18
VAIAPTPPVNNTPATMDGIPAPMSSPVIILSTKIVEEVYTIEEEVPCLIVYDSTKSISEKLRYIREQGLGGIMFWEVAGDNGDLIDTIKKFKDTN